MFELYYKEATGWLPLPAWAHFFYRLGRTVAGGCVPSTTVVVAPASAGALPFVALGTIVGSWGNKARGSLDEHWEMLTGLQPGTLVSYARYKPNDRTLRLACLRVSARQTQDELVLEFGRGKKQDTPDTYRMGKGARAFRVSPLNITQKDVGPDLKVKSREMAVVLDVFLQGGIHEYFTTSRPDCLILGNDSLLRTEASLELGTGDGTAIGTLGDVLRIRQGNGTWHTMICPLRGHTPQAEPFRTVLFDGPTAWLRHRTDYPNANHVVVASHTGMAVPELVAELRATFRDGAVPTTLRQEVGDVPAGLEIISFQRQ